MIFENLGALREHTFSVSEISARREVFRSGTVFDYRSKGRSRNLLHIITSGERHYRLANEDFVCDAGSVLFIPEHTRYMTCNDAECAGIGICFSFGDDISIREGVYTDRSDSLGDYLRLFERLNDSLISDPHSALHHTSLLYRILDRMTSEVSQSEHYAKMLAPALELIQASYRENLSVGEYAAACNLSESYFRRIFGQRIGMSPLEYRNSLRFEEVRRLRRMGLSVGEIAEQCGFCDAAYLRRLFRRETGESVRSCIEAEIV